MADTQKPKFYNGHEMQKPKTKNKHQGIALYFFCSTERKATDKHDILHTAHIWHLVTSGGSFQNYRNISGAAISIK
jgi:hypothetical protein